MALKLHLGEVDRRLYQPECVHSRKSAVAWRRKDLVPDRGRVATALQHDSVHLLLNLENVVTSSDLQQLYRPWGLIGAPHREGGSFAL